MITTTYETSKALWDAGVRIETEIYWTDVFGLHYRLLQPTDDDIPAPTFTELVEWLKGKGYELKFDTGSDIMVLALRNENQKRIVVTATTNSNLTEAAAECCMEVMRREGK